MHIVKVVCIVGKIAIVVGMLLLATYMYTAKYKKCTMIPVMLVAYCLIVSQQNIKVECKDSSKFYS